MSNHEFLGNEIWKLYDIFILIKYILFHNDLGSEREKDSSSWECKIVLNLLQG